MIPDIKELNFPKKDGKQYATLTQATVNIADMGEKTITTQARIDGGIVPDFSQDWEVEFQGEKYIMPLRVPAGAKENTSLNSTIDLTFQHWAVWQLKRWPFVTIQPIKAGTYIADEEVASVQLNLGDFCVLFGQVLEYYYGDAITIDLNSAWEYDSAPTLITISHTKIWNVLVDAFYPKYGVRWEIAAAEATAQGQIRGGDRYIIKVGYPTTEVDHIFEYGFEGGLLKVERQVQSEEIRNMLKGRGGETNIPFRYFKDTDPNNPDFRPDPDWVEELATVYFTNLMPATFRSYVQGWKAAHISKYPGYTAKGEANVYAPWAYRKGYTDTVFSPVEFVADEITINPATSDKQVEILPGYAPYIKKGSSIDKYGPLPDTLDNNDDIYPTLQGTGLDVAVAVEQIESDDVAGATENDAVVSNIPDGACRTTATGVDKSAYATAILPRIYFTVETGKMANLTEDCRILSVTQQTKKGLETIDAAANAELVSKSVSVYDAVTGEKRSASGIPAGSYYFEITAEVHNLTTDKTLNITVGTETPKLESATPDDKWRKTFDIWVKNIWNSSKLSTETDAQYAERVWKPVLGDREGHTAKVVFTSGALVHEDYEFTIVGIPVPDSSKSYEGEQSHWRITLAKSEAELEATGLYVPSTQKQGKAGDTFVLTGTEMTHEPYVVDAEVRLDDWKKDQLREVKEIKPTAVVTTDRVRLNNEGKPDALINQLRAGNSLRLFDKRFFNEEGKAYETLYLQSITYTYREPSSDDAALNPDVEIVLGNEYTISANPVSMMQGEISALQRQVGAISNVEQIVRAVGDRLYLRKDGISDRSLSPTQFFSLLTSGDFRAGLIGGAGWGFYKDENGNWVLETDRLSVRQDMSVNTLVINQAEGRGGMEIDTAAYIDGVTRVEDTPEGYVCYFDQKGGSVANLFHVDDVAFCNRWTPENTDLKFYKRRVTAVGADYITLSKTDVNGTGVPAEGDNIIHFGNYTDKTRQYIKVRDVVGGGYERYIEELNSVNASGVEYYFVGKQAGKARWFVGNKDLVPYSGKGDGSYIEYIDRKFNLHNVRLSITSSIVSETTDSEGNPIATEKPLGNYFKELQQQIDGVVESYNGQGAPTLTNYPASGWTTDEERKRHNRDIYTDITPYVDDATTPTAGQSWRWYYNSETDYGWVKIADSDAVKALQMAKLSVLDNDVLFIQTGSETVKPALPTVNTDGAITNLNGWSTTAPTWKQGEYIWQCTYVRKGDGTARFAGPTCLSGINGNGIDTVDEYYAVNNSDSTPPTSWQKNPTKTPVPTATHRYLWNYEEVTYTLGNKFSTQPRVLSMYSEDGRAFLSSTDYYLATADGSNAPTGGWKTNFADAGFSATNRYLWNYEVSTYSKAPTSVASNPRIIGVWGAQGQQGLRGLQGPQGEQGIPGENGEDGKTSYFHIKYSAVANPTSSSQMTETPSTYIGTYVDYNAADSSDPKKYTWARFQGLQGADGSQGIPGKNGEDGKTSYLHIKYSNDGGKMFTPAAGGLAIGETPGDYIGQYTDFTQADSTDVTKYTWSKIKGDPGTSISITSTEVRYSTVHNSATQPADATFTLTAVPTLTAGQYLWSRTKVTYSNTDSTVSYGVSRLGTNGADGTSITIKSTSVTYAKSTTSTQPADSAFTYSSIGAAGVKAGEYLWTKTEIVYSDNTPVKTYSVSRIGSDGTTGTPGAPGADGRTPYVHWAYANSADGVTGFSTTYFNDALYVGTCTDYNAADPTSPSAYEWARLRGADGTDAKIVVVNSDATAFTYSNDFKTLVGPQSIALSATLQGTSGYQWSYKLPGQSAFTNISGATSATYSLAHNASIWGSGTTNKAITLRCTSGGVHDEVTIVRVSSGANGTNGTNGTSVTVSSTSVSYQASANGTTVPTGTWSTSVPSVAAGQYLWTKTVVNYSDGKSTTAYSVSRQGVNGADGEDGKDGTSVTIASTSITYYKGSSATQPADSAFTLTSIGTLTAGQYLWTKTEVKYSDGTITKGYSASYIGHDGSNGTPGTPGADGKTTYVHFAYGSSITGALPHPTAVGGFSTTPFAGAKYIGVCTDYNAADPTTNVGSTYEWSEYKGEDGADAYTVLLSNESHIFEGDTEKAVAASTTSEVIAYKGATQVPATIGSITGAPTGMTVAISNNGKTNAYFTVSVTTALTTKQGVLSVPVTVDGKQFTQKFSWSLSLRGKDGRGIVSVKEMYAVNNSSTIAPADSAFSANIPQTSATNRYLWNMEVTTYTDNTSETTDKIVIGVHGANGEDGASITAVTNYYLASASATGVTASTAGWTTDASASAATMTDAKPYLWNYEKITYSKGNPTQTTPHVVGRLGRGVAKIEEEYYLSTSQTQLAGGSWLSEANKPAWQPGKFMWTRTKVTYTDGKTEYMGAVCVTGTPGTSVLAQYSADGSAWHPTFTAGDVWMRTSDDGGTTWSPAMRIVGESYTPNLLLGTIDAEIKFTGSNVSQRFKFETPLTQATGAGKVFTASFDYEYENVSTGSTYSEYRLGAETNGPMTSGATGYWGAYLYLPANATGLSGRGRFQGRLKISDNATSIQDYCSFFIQVKSGTARIWNVKLEEGENSLTAWTPAASEMVGTDGKDGQWRKFQWAKNNSATTAPTSGWQDTPLTAAAGEYVWMRSGIVVPPATAPAKWDDATRLTGDKGADGQSVYMLDIDNEVSGVICDASGAVTGTYPTSQASVYKGSTKLTSGVTYSIPQKTGISTVNITTAGAITMSGMTADKAEITVQAKVDNVTLTSVVSLYKVKPGANGQAAVMYSIEPSVGNITKSMTGVLSATSVTCSVYKTTGNTARVLTGDHTLTYQRLPDGATGTLTRTNGVSSAVTVLPTTEAVIFELKNGSTLLDRERVPVLADASDLEIGGRNLLLDSGKEYINGNYNIAKYMLTIPPATGDACVFTLWGELASTKTEFQIFNSGGMVRLGILKKIADGVYQVKFKWTNGEGTANEVTPTFINLYHMASAQTGTSTVNRVKLEKGNVATDWSPAPEDIENRVDTFDYLKEAMKGNTVVDGGLVMSSLMKLGTWSQATDPDKATMTKVYAGMNGIYASDRSIASWWGGDMVDRFNASNTAISPVPANAAAALVRMDGTGYFAKGNIMWRSDGSGSVAGGKLSWDASGNVTLGAGVTVAGGSGMSDTTLTSLLQFVNGINQLIVPVDASGNELPYNGLTNSDGTTKIKAIKAKFNFYSVGGVSSLGMGSATGGGSGSGGGASALVDLLDVNISNLSKGQMLQYNGTHWTNVSGIATEAYVNTRINNLINGAPAAYDTLKEIADVLQGNVNSIGDIMTALGNKADKSQLADYVTLGTAQTITAAKTFKADINMSGTGDNGNRIYWSRNSDWGQIWFKNTADGDTDSYLGFQTGDNGNEYFRFSHKSSGATSDTVWATIKANGITAASFIKTGGTASQFLMADGSVKALTDITSAYVTALGTSGNYLTWTKNGAVNNITVPFATAASVLQGENLDATQPTPDMLTNYKVRMYRYDATSIGWVESLLVGSPSTGWQSWELAGPGGLRSTTGQLRWRFGLSEWDSWRTILDSVNYATILDSRYYTEAEINTKLTDGSVTKLGTATVGSGIRPIYLNAGVPTQCLVPATKAWFQGLPSIGTNGVMDIGRYIDFHPTSDSEIDYSVRLDGGTSTTGRTFTFGSVAGELVTHTAGTAIGGTAKPVYIANSGAATALSATVGAANRPVYLNAGTITAGTYTFGNASGNAPISNGTVNTNLNADMLDGIHASGLLTSLVNSGDYNIGLTVGGTTKTLNLKGVGGFTTLTFTKSDNGGLPAYLLIADVTSWYNAGTTGSSSIEYGINGWIYGWRGGNMAGTMAQRIIAMACYSTNYKKLQTDNTEYVRPRIVAYNGKYYLALYMTGSGRNHYFIGRAVGLLSSFISVNCNADGSAEGLTVHTSESGIAYNGGAITATSLSVSGLATLNGGATIPTGKKLTIGPVTIEYDSANKGLKVSGGGLYTDSYLTALGIGNVSGSTGGGSNYDRLDSWSDYTTAKEGYVLSAKLGYSLYQDVNSLKSGAAVTVTTTGTGNAVTAISKSGTVITATKGTTFLTSHQSLTHLLRVDGTNGTAAGVSELINKLSVGSSAPVDADYYVSQYAGGGTTTTTYHRRPMSALWSYIKPKTDTLYQPKGSFVTLDTAQIITGVKTFAANAKKQTATLSRSLFNTDSGYDYLVFADTLAPTVIRGSYISFQNAVGNTGVKMENDGNLTAVKFIKSGGTSSQFLKADGSVDSNTYLTTGSAASTYLKLSGGSMANTNVVTNMNADLIDGVHLTSLFRQLDFNPDLDAFADNNNQNGITYINSSDLSVTNAPFSYGSVLNISRNAASWQIGVASTANASPYFRSRWWSSNGGTWGEWKRIAFLDSNVASATKLADNTAFKAWGQTFFENGKPKNMTGALTSVTDLTMSGKLKIGNATLSWDSANNALKIDGNVYATGGVSALGASGVSGDTGAGSLFGLMKSWPTSAPSSATTDALGANLGYELHTRVKSLEGGSATSITATGSGNAITAITKSGTVITATKGATFLTAHQSLDGYVRIGGDGVAEMGRYIDFHSADYGTNKTQDYTARIDAGSANVARVLTLPTTSGTLALTSQLTNGSVTKVGTATVGSASRPVYLNGGVPTALSSTVGANNLPTYLNGGTITAVSSVGEAYLSWGGKSLSGSISPVDCAASALHSANRLAFANPAGITIEYSRDGGSTWSTYSKTDAEKINLVSGLSHPLYIGGKNTDVTVSCRLRITLNATQMGVYTRVQKMLINISTDGATGSSALVEMSKKGSETTFATVGTYPISGWSGWNSIPLGGIPFGGGDTQTSNAAVFRFTFFITGLSSNTSFSSALSVRDLYLIGDTYWATPQELAKSGHLYTYDSSKNATFPAKVTAASFSGPLSGNASTATTLATARTINGTSFNGSANITTSYWGTARNISIADSTSAHTGAATSVNGSGDVTLKLPATIAATSFVGALSGNATTATTLETARTINGTSFNGSANITTANWGTSRNIGIVNSDGTGTAVVTSVNGSAAVNLKLPATIKAALSGNATTATTLQTTRTIWGQNFNGGANVSGNMTGVGSITASGDYQTTKSNAAVKVNNASSVLGLYNSTNRGVYDFTTNQWLVATNGTNSWMAQGNVGIGTTSPSYKLHVSGTLYASGAASLASTLSVTGNLTHSASVLPSGNNSLRVGSETLNYAGVHSRQLINNTEALMWIWQATNHEIAFATNAVERMRISAAGTVAINITSPSSEAKLHVGGNIVATGGITALSSSSTSDMRLKRVIRDITLDIRQIAGAPSFIHAWKDAAEYGGGEFAGSSAQYWLRVLPQAVSGKQWLALDYGKTALLSAIALARRSETHEQRIRRLEKENEQLREQIRQIKNSIF